VFSPDRLLAALLLPLSLSCLSCAAKHPAEIPANLAKVPASKFCKEVEGSASPDGRFAVAVGYSKPEGVDWEKLRWEGDGYYIDSDSPLLINALIDRKRDRALAVLPTEHFGTLQRYNHESLAVAWSANSSHMIAVQSWKWSSDYAVLWKLDREGRVTGELDLLPIASQQLREALVKKDAKAAQVFRTRYEVALSEPRVNDEGEVSFECWAEVPKSMEYPSVTLKVRFKAKAETGGKLTATDLAVTDGEVE